MLNLLKYQVCYSIPYETPEIVKLPVSCGIKHSVNMTDSISVYCTMCFRKQIDFHPGDLPVMAECDVAGGEYGVMEHEPPRRSEIWLVGFC